VTAVIAAAGSGERLGAGGPKAFVPLGGRPMVEWSIEAFRASPSMRSIVVAAPPGLEQKLGRGGLGAVEGAGLNVVEGGATRAQSVSNALEAVGTELVAIHDAARPLVTPELIEGVIATLIADPDADGAIAATPVTDTIKQANNPLRCSLTPYREEKEQRSVVRTLDRGRLWAAQTPQVFRAAVVREALGAWAERAGAESEGVREATDEAMLVEASGGRVLIHPAPPENLKVTTPLDLKLAELLLAGR
jgi:2-C-methyl-D-erythritol 4-phosphate cytidylyltransferase